MNATAIATNSTMIIGNLDKVWNGSFSGIGADNNFVDILELRDHPWFLVTQFHPEFKSRPNKPHPLFRDFVKAALEHNSRKKVRFV